jgi:hypothetical protein
MASIPNLGKIELPTHLLLLRCAELHFELQMLTLENSATGSLMHDDSYQTLNIVGFRRISIEAEETSNLGKHQTLTLKNCAKGLLVHFTMYKTLAAWNLRHILFLVSSLQRVWPMSR